MKWKTGENEKIHINSKSKTLKISTVILKKIKILAGGIQIYIYMCVCVLTKMTKNQFTFILLKRM